MRQWNVDPKFLCNQHLLGEHVEHHMFAGCLLKGISLRGYIEKGLVEVHRLQKRHNQLVGEMKRRGMNHKSPFPNVELYRKGKINVSENIKELKNRCLKCKEKIEEFK
jgi:hypothetical protein